MRKLISVFTCLVVVLAVSVLLISDSSLAVDKAYKIAVLLPGPTGYFVATKAGVNQAAEDFSVEITYSDAQWDAAMQLSQVEDFIQKGVDIIAVIGVDAEAIKPGIAAANEAGVPILALVNAVGSNPSGEYEGLVTYVGQSDLETGKLSGKMAVDLLGKSGGKIVMIEGVPGTNPQRQRKLGFNSVIEQYDNIEVVYNQTSHWNKEEAMKIMEDLLQRGIEFDLVYCQDDNSAIGAGMVLQEYDQKDDVYVIGTDGSKQGLEAIRQGIIDRTSWKSAIDEGYSAIEAAVKYLNGEEVPPVVLKMQVEVNPDNVDDFQGEW